MHLLTIKRLLYTDTVIRDALWMKLTNSQISSKMLKMLKSLYSNVKACIRNNENMSYSELFDLTLGVKQGEPLSPLLFILFINDIKDYMDFTNLSVNDIEKLSLYMLLFADDIALFTTDPKNLQTKLDCINRFSCQWGFTINVDKAKICIFERKKSRNNYTWCINNIDVEIVDSFCYLGMKFYYNGNFNQAIKTLNEQALKAYNGLLSLFTRVSLDIKTKLLLFDSKVAPIILYGSEIWGVYDFKEVDKLHVQFCK